MFLQFPKLNILKFEFWKTVSYTPRHRSLVMANDQQIFNFAFMDLETTGLPSEEHNKTRITELSIAVVESSHISLGVYPRVCNKLNLCFNPGKIVQPIATEITGLANTMLENQSPFSSSAADSIKGFLSLHKKPICFVAHNGNKFDFPIFRAELERVKAHLPEDILCIDSLLCFQDLHRMEVHTNSMLESVTSNTPAVRGNDEVDVPVKKMKTAPLEFTDEFDQFLCTVVDEYDSNIKKQNIQKVHETTPKHQIIRTTSSFDSVKRNIFPQNKQRTSFKLCDIYKRLTHKDPNNSHHAEADVDYLIHCAAFYGEKFVEWSNKNAKYLSSIPHMRPGIEIGF
ncbi:hypothetical protein HHI36_018837 [Cryptolaemus montrouzieri]|uniref:Exonuclease domain-containing protein n=1 Tax=Cryptolaemus montrouzieri TaxID=559131 RepID=A0ABD2P130_9CUCU